MSRRRMPEPMIRWMIRRDMASVMAIENACFGEHAWQEDEFVHFLRQRNAVGMVALCPRTDDVLGFMLYELHKGRIALESLAVDPKCHRCGIGRRLMQKLTGKISERRRRVETLVRDSNLAAHLFFQAVGWRAHVPVVRRPWPDCDDDGYRFVFKHRMSPMPLRIAAGTVA